MGSTSKTKKMKSYRINKKGAEQNLNLPAGEAGIKKKGKRSGYNK